MKTQEEIENKANDWLVETPIEAWGGAENGFIKGYTQCQEDMADKKYTEEDMLKCWNTAFTDAMNIDSETYKPIFYSDFIKSLNKQG